MQQPLLHYSFKQYSSPGNIAVSTKVYAAKFNLKTLKLKYTQFPTPLDPMQQRVNPSGSETNLKLHPQYQSDDLLRNASNVDVLN